MGLVAAYMGLVGAYWGLVMVYVGLETEPSVALDKPASDKVGRGGDSFC